MKHQPELEIIDQKPLIDLPLLLILVLALVAGTLAAAIILPAIIPGLMDSLTGNDPKVYWYLARGSAFAAYLLLWFSMLLGVSMSSRLSRTWLGNAVSYDLHQFVSLLGMGFVLFHALIILGDHYMGADLVSLLIPFANSHYRPFWVGLGQIGLYLWVIVVGSFYVRKRIGTKAWRAVHFLTFLLYLAGLAHGISAGTDSGTFWAAGVYWITGGSLMFLILYRVLAAAGKRYGWAV